MITPLRSGQLFFIFFFHVRDAHKLNNDTKSPHRDMRRKKCVYTIAAHNHLVSSVRFEPTTGWFLATSSYDNTCKLFGSENWSLGKTLAGHGGKVTGIDVSAGEQCGNLIFMLLHPNKKIRADEFDDVVDLNRFCLLTGFVLNFCHA
jgi:WD40 repeat protein